MSIFSFPFCFYNCYYEKIGNEVKNITDELPFEIPNNWVWIRLKNLVNIGTGKKDANFGGIDGRFDFFTCAMEPIKSNSYSYDGEYLILPGNGANVGKSIHYFGKFEAYQRTYLLSKLLNVISFEYLKINLDARWLEYNKDKLFGSAIPYIKLSNIEEFLIPLPPINEQTKIIEKYIKYEPLISHYEIVERKLTNLEFEFEEKFKASILQYAIEGKLVKQDPNDEPASVLLEHIKAEKEKLIKEGKIKRDKYDSEIILGDDKNYYQNQWIYGKLKSFLIPNKNGLPVTEYIKYIDIDAIDNKKHEIRGYKLIKTETATPRARRILMEGDILYSMVRPYLENIAKVTKDYSNCIGSTGFYVCRPIKYLMTDFLFIILLSPYFKSKVMPHMKGDNSPSITSKVLEDVLIAIPSLTQQKKIKSKVTTIMSFLG